MNKYEKRLKTCDGVKKIRTIWGRNPDKSRNPCENKVSIINLFDDLVLLGEVCVGQYKLSGVAPRLLSYLTVIKLMYLLMVCPMDQKFLYLLVARFFRSLQLEKG